MKVAVVCIAKNEDNYIEEWVRYNLKLGFDDVFVYENNWRCKFEHPNLIKIPFDHAGGDRQPQSYIKFIRDNHSNYDYAAFFDVDEYLVLKNHKNIKDFLAEYVEYPAIGINWALFGDNGLTNVVDSDYSVVKRFTKRGHFNGHIKSIVKLEPHTLMSTHHPVTCSMVSPNKEVIQNQAENPNGSYDIVQLNHYFCKTREEFQSKMERGRACDGSLHNHFFDRHNLNDVEDLHALNFINS